MAATIDPATSWAQIESPALIMADIRLRNHENGNDALHAIRALCPYSSALMITNDMAPDRLKEAAQVNAKLLHKPSHSDQLRQAIQEAVKVIGLQNRLVI